MELSAARRKRGGIDHTVRLTRPLVQEGISYISQSVPRLSPLIQFTILQSSRAGWDIDTVHWGGGWESVDAIL